MRKVKTKADFERSSLRSSNTINTVRSQRSFDKSRNSLDSTNFKGAKRLGKTTRSHQVVICDTEPIVEEKTDETNEITKICVPLRKDLNSLREKLNGIQEDEDKTIETYQNLEIRQFQCINSIIDQYTKKQKQNPDLKDDKKYKYYSQEISQAFENFMNITSQNKSMIENIVSNDHHVNYKISDAQNKASDARFRFDGDRIAIRDLQEELSEIQKKLDELNLISEAISSECIGLNMKQKSLETEKQRMIIKMEDQVNEFNTLLEEYEELKQTNDILKSERAERERAMRQRLADAIETRDNLISTLENMEIQEKVEAKVVMELENNELEKKQKLNRVTDELVHMCRLYQHRNEQIGKLKHIIR